ncbi:class I SAM-dependent methyltransferase [Jatrophihabitans cynanchi]|jgi:SAM-dependent methyltransferase|uniref:Class I SAM-dependent methyltransferase n=1 Tax=Jatrophihabitans cynanchi TaxID=2944128 RepID=A0ABY7JTN1_9ACTN|nr:class I SAM-dependent methyltransferase [Jatrophihabitans sp. SB3-54]WAX55916.1 class I SAM-dependent methyltransferase [Jatrophihabitans sp. SB3-54]
MSRSEAHHEDGDGSSHRATVPRLSQDDSHWSFYASEHELSKSKRKLDNFLLPLLERLDARRVLEVGCGSAAFPIWLRDLGYEAFGVDPSLQPVITDQYAYLASTDGQHLPHEDRFFDLVYSLEVIEHVGARFRARELAEDVSEQRAAFVAELCRVSARYVFIATPNRLFPADEHAEDRRGRHGFRLHSPFEGFTLSASDLQQLFAPNGFTLRSFGNAEGYYALERVRRVLGRPGQAASRMLLKLPSVPWLAKSPLNPHLFLLFERAQ